MITIPDDNFSWVEPYLIAWARYMRDPELRLSAPERTPAFMGEVRDGYGDPQACYDLAGEDRAIQVIIGAYEDLTPAQQCAVMHVHLYAVFAFRLPIEGVYLSARAHIGAKLVANDFYLEPYPIQALDIPSSPVLHSLRVSARPKET